MRVKLPDSLTGYFGGYWFQNGVGEVHDHVALDPGWTFKMAHRTGEIIINGRKRTGLWWHLEEQAISKKPSQDYWDLIERSGMEPGQPIDKLMKKVNSTMPNDEEPKDPSKEETEEYQPHPQVKEEESGVDNEPSLIPLNAIDISEDTIKKLHKSNIQTLNDLVSARSKRLMGILKTSKKEVSALQDEAARFMHG